MIGEEGKAIVAEACPHFCAFYLAEAATGDPGVREAACHSIAELACKVDPGVVAAYVPQLLSALLSCLEVRR